MRVLSLCSGYGGLELALDVLFPGRVSTVAVCDNYAPPRVGDGPRTEHLGSALAPGKRCGPRAKGARHLPIPH